jgi:hypothetical protein
MNKVLQRENYCSRCRQDAPPYLCMVFDEELEQEFERHGETALRSKLNDLHMRIIGALYDLPVTSRDNPKPSAGCTQYTRDGFMPGYTKAAKRVLFIARESRYSNPYTLDPKESPSDIIKNTYMRFKRNKAFTFETRMLAVAAQLLAPVGTYGSYEEIFHGRWPAMREAVVEGAISFGYLELSKFANTNYYSNIDMKLMNTYAQFDATHEFGRQQIELLKPDIIVTMNLVRYFPDALRVMVGSEVVPCDEHAAANRVPALWSIQAPWDSSLRLPLLDLWHFSARKRKAEYFEPVLRAMQQHLF